MKKFISILLIITMLVLGVLLNFAGCADKDKGVKSGSKIVASSDNFEISYSMMEYYANSYYSNWYQQNYYYMLLGYISFNPDKPLNEQYIDSLHTQTWYDYFVQGTKTTVETYLKYCEVAKADATVDFTQLENDANAYAEESIAQLKEAAKQYSQDYEINMTLNNYIKQNFGKTVTAETIKKALVIEHIASKYYEIVYQRTLDAVDSRREDKYFEENLSSFVTAEYLVYTVSNPKTVEFPDEWDYIGGYDSYAYRKAIEGKTAEQAAKIDPADYWDGAESKAYKEALKTAEENKKINEESLARDREIIERLASATTEEEFRNIILEVTSNDPTKTASYFLSTKLGQKLFGGVKAEYDIPYESYEVMGTSAATNDVWYWNNLEVDIENIELSIKITEKELAAETDANAKKALEDSLEHYKRNLETAKDKLDEAETNGYYSYSVYFVTEAAHRDDYKARNVGHILFKVDATKETDPAVSYKTKEEAKAAAEALLAEINAAMVDGKISKEKFEEFGEDTHDTQIFYEDVEKGDMVEEFDDWLFNATVVGNIGLVETTYGWHIMYYGGEGEELVWRIDAKERAAAEDINAWYENLPTYNIQFNDEVFEDIFKNAN